MRIPKIELRTLPQNRPTSEATASCGHNKHDYDPGIWGIEYASFRYLSGITDNNLWDRYRAIIRNMRSYTESERDVIPIISYQSSWYWFRKEYQTRLEFAFRGIKLPALRHVSSNTSKHGPLHPTPPNGTEIIFRYGSRQYMQKMVKEGIMRFSPAHAYRSIGNDEARCDDELQKHSYLPSRYTTVTHESGQRIKVIGDIRKTVQGSEYYLICFSCVWDSELFREFNADICVAITDPSELAKRLKSASRDTFPQWYFHDGPVQYFDPYERAGNEHLSTAISKDFRFAYQNEYRILWTQLGASPVDGFKTVNIGPAQDIMTMYEANGEKICF